MRSAYFSTPGRPPVIQPTVLDEIYTDREEHLDYFWQEAINGPGYGLDIHGAAGLKSWLCESKWWNGKKVGKRDVESLLKKET